MNTDAHLDPEGETLPAEHFMDLHAMKLQHSTQLKNRVEPRTEESARMNEDLLKDPTPLMDDDDVHVIMASADGKSLQVILENDVVDLPKLFRKAYHTDTVCSKILAHPEAHPRF
jgi:hypothetical protein